MRAYKCYWVDDFPSRYHGSSYENGERIEANNSIEAAKEFCKGIYLDCLDVDEDLKVNMSTEDEEGVIRKHEVVISVNYLVSTL